MYLLTMKNSIHPLHSNQTTVKLLPFFMMIELQIISHVQSQ